MFISACIVVRNEEKLISRCFDSIYNKVDEIILVHDGPCSDKTLEIGKKYNCRIYIRDFKGYMEPHLVFALNKAKGDWIFRIDADEYLSPEIKSLKILDSQEVVAYEFAWPILYKNKQKAFSWPHKLCLFKKNKISFLAIMHFSIVVSGVVRRIDYVLCHAPEYDNFTWERFRSKHLNRAKLQAESYFKDFGEVEKFNYKARDWPGNIKLRKKYPLILMPAEFLVTFFKNIRSGGWREGFYGIKLSFYTSLYRFMINYYIYKIKKRH